MWITLLILGWIACGVYAYGLCMAMNNTLIWSIASGINYRNRDLVLCITAAPVAMPCAFLFNWSHGYPLKPEFVHISREEAQKRCDEERQGWRL